MKATLPALGLAALLSLTAGASAQQAAPAPQQVPATAPPAAQAPDQVPGRRDLMAACRSDFKSLCNDASGLGARLQCLKENRSKLSPDCSSLISTVLGNVQAKAAAGGLPRPLQACQQDLASLCPDLGKGEPGRMKCLRDNSAKLSPGCAETIKTAREQVKNRMQVCEADRARLCGSAGKQPREQLTCLKGKEAELSAECRQVVAAARTPQAKALMKGDGAPPSARAPAAAPQATPQAAPIAPAPS